MKYKILRQFMRAQNVRREYLLKDCKLIIDGHYFKELYQKSGAGFIVGGEYDRFANYLKTCLNIFISSNVKCYVIFNGAMKVGIDKRMTIHQNIIKNTDAAVPGAENNVYCEPIFVKDVCKDVLDELNIKYFVCEYDAREEIFNIAKRYDCPVLTRNFEYALYYVTCVDPNSLTFSREEHKISCSVYDKDLCNKFFALNDVMPVFLTTMDEDSFVIHKLCRLANCRVNNLLPAALTWFKNKTKQKVMKTIVDSLTDSQKIYFTNSYNETEHLMGLSKKNLAVQYFESHLSGSGHSIYNFEIAIGIGKIAIPYINLNRFKTFSGSWLIVDKNRRDAMLPAIDIVMFIYGLINRSRMLKFKFIGRKFENSSVWMIEKQRSLKQEYLFDERASKNRDRKNMDHLKTFLSEALPKFDFITLESAPSDCWLLIIALIYYCRKADRPFVTEAYSVLMSYVMLGIVSDKVGVIKRSNLIGIQYTKSDVNGDVPHEECVLAANAFIDLFYTTDARLKDIFDRKILHGLAEFQHCLQHLNYLNRMSESKIPNTKYRRVLNLTFVYNLIIVLKDESAPLDYLKTHLNAPAVFTYYKSIVDVFEKCLASIA